MDSGQVYYIRRFQMKWDDNNLKYKFIQRKKKEKTSSFNDVHTYYIDIWIYKIFLFTNK